MKKLNDIVLPEKLPNDCLIIQESGVLAEYERTISGRKIYWYGSDGNPNMDIVTQIDDLWITYSNYKALIALSKTTAPMTLIWDNQQYQVLWRHEEPPVFSAIPVQIFTIYQDTDFFHSLNLRLVQIQ